MTYRNIFNNQGLFKSILFVLFNSILISCEKLEPERIIILQTGSIENLTSYSCDVNGSIIDNGGENITEYGHCWSAYSIPTIEDNAFKLYDKKSKGRFTSNLKGLKANMTYRIRAYAINSKGIYYGDIEKFTTLSPIIPTVNTFAISDINYDSAKGGGNVINDGGNDVINRGVCWSTNHNPTTINNHTNDGNGTGSYNSVLTNLISDTTYYVRAFATNSVGTGYGNEIKFSTSALVIPEYVSSVVENATPSIIEITYSLSLANIVPATSAFTVTVNSVNRTISGVSISGTMVQLTLSSAIVYGLIVTVAYMKPATNPLQTASGGQAASITAQNVTNNVDPAIPVYISSVVENTTPTILEMIFSLPLSQIVPDASAFTVTVNSVNRTVIGVNIDNGNVELILSSKIVYGDIVTVAYTKPATNPLQTTEGGQSESITAQFVINKTHPLTVTDFDNNIYHIILIGSQLWTKENLKVTKYNNGDLIGTTTPSNLNIYGESTPKYEWAFDGNENYVPTYGRLYTWYVVMDNRKLCPSGWHVPSNEEWQNLSNYLGGEEVAGGKLKETGFTHWISPNKDATNESGFTALPGGMRSADGWYSHLGETGAWWSSSEFTDEVGSSWAIFNGSGGLSGWGNTEKSWGLSIRCTND